MMKGVNSTFLTNLLVIIALLGQLAGYAYASCNMSASDDTQSIHHHEEHSQMAHTQKDRSQIDHAHMNHSGMNHSNMNHVEMNHSEMTHASLTHGDGTQGCCGADCQCLANVFSTFSLLTNTNDDEFMFNHKERISLPSFHLNQAESSSLYRPPIIL